MRILQFMFGKLCVPFEICVMLKFGALRYISHDILIFSEMWPWRSSYKSFDFYPT